MDLDTYPVHSSDDLLMHTFVSRGPKGEIIKRVEFQEIGKNRYNLAFGDDDEEVGLNDKARTNNKDREKVLATVAIIIDNFLQYNPHVRIYIGGSTTCRTRLYQIKIVQFLQKINVGYDIHGSIGGRWKPFEKENKYDAFLSKLKHGQMGKVNRPKKQEQHFDIKKWRAQYASKFTIVPKDHFSDVSNHPFLNRSMTQQLHSPHRIRGHQRSNCAIKYKSPNHHG